MSAIALENKATEAEVAPVSAIALKIKATVAETAPVSAITLEKKATEAEVAPASAIALQIKAADAESAPTSAMPHESQFGAYTTILRCNPNASADDEPFTFIILHMYSAFVN